MEIKFYKFADDQALVAQFIDAASPNRELFQVLSGKIFGLKLRSPHMHYIAVDEFDNRIHDKFDFDFLESEITKYLIMVDTPKVDDASISLESWVELHNHGKLSFNKVMKMYKIAIES